MRDQLGGSPVCPVWTLSDEEKMENQKRWKERVGYGRRWIVEIVFSAFKRIFGDCVMATNHDHAQGSDLQQDYGDGRVGMM